MPSCKRSSRVKAIPCRVKEEPLFNQTKKCKTNTHTQLNAVSQTLENGDSYMSHRGQHGAQGNQIAVVFLIFFLSVVTCSVFSRLSFHFIILIRGHCYIWPYLVKQHSLFAATGLLQVQLQCSARVYLFCPMVTEPELTPLAAPLLTSSSRPLSL